MSDWICQSSTGSLTPAMHTAECGQEGFILKKRKKKILLVPILRPVLRDKARL